MRLIGGIDRDASCALNPNDAPAYAHFAFALARAGKLEDSIQACTNSLDIRPNDAKGEQNLATLLLQAGRSNEALGRLNRAVAPHPESADAHNVPGFLLARTGRRDDGVDHLEKAVTLKPDSFQFRFNLGRVLAARHSFAEAIRRLKRRWSFPGPRSRRPWAVWKCRRLRTPRGMLRGRQPGCAPCPRRGHAREKLIPRRENDRPTCLLPISHGQAIALRSLRPDVRTSTGAWSENSSWSNPGACLLLGP